MIFRPRKPPGIEILTKTGLQKYRRVPRFPVFSSSRASRARLTGAALLLGLFLLPGWRPVFAGTFVLTDNFSRGQMYKWIDVFVDESGAMTPAEVAALDQSQFQSRFLRAPRYKASEAILWIRFRLENRTRFHHWILDLNRARLDSVTGYRMTPEGPLQFARSGWETPLAMNSFPYRDVAIPITLGEGQSDEYLIRVHNPQTNFVMGLQLFEQRAFAKSDRLESTILGLYFGILLAMVITNGFFSVALRDRAFLLYSIFLVLFGWVMLHGRGIDRQFLGVLDGIQMHTLYYLTIQVTVFIGVLFIREFFTSDQKNFSDWVLDGVLVFSGLHFLFALIATLIGFPNYPRESLLLTLLPCLFAVFVLVFHRLVRRETVTLYILLGTGLLVIGVMIQIFMNRGAVPYSNFSANSTLIGSAFDMILISLGLADRFRRLESQSERHRLASETKSRFLAHMSHEIRTPLNAVLGMSELLDESSLNDEQRKYLGILRRSGRSLLSTINDILDLSKIEAGRIDLEAIRFRPTTVLENLRDEHASAAAARGIVFKLEINPLMPEPVRGDPTRLRQILGNLLVNAVKFTEEGSVTLRAGPLERYDGHVWILFEVIDTGIGIPRAQRDRIFESFTQADDSTTRRYGGTGLGLAISREAVGLMGGEIGVESTPGRGSRFYVSLPFEPGGPTNTAPEPATPPDARVESSSPALSILLAEDNEDNRLLFQAFLKRTNHKVDVALNGAEAVERFWTGKYDVIFMDIQMPVLSGLEAVRQIRGLESDQAPRTPIYALTAHAFEHEREASHAAGCDGHITKPLEKATLLGILDKIPMRD